MRILRVTHYKCGAPGHCWYPDYEAVKRQLATETTRVKSSEVTGEDWYECEQIDLFMALAYREVES